MAHTLAQKILQMHTDEEVGDAGQIVRCRTDFVLANDITAPLAIKSFREMGAKDVFDKDKVALVMDHFTPQKDIDSAIKLKALVNLPVPSILPTTTKAETLALSMLSYQSKDL